MQGEWRRVSPKYVAVEVVSAVVSSVVLLAVPSVLWAIGVEWAWILVAAAVILFLVLWVRAVVDVWRRDDLTAGAKSAWAIIMLILPFIGLLLYTMLRPSDAQIQQRARR